MHTYKPRKCEVCGREFVPERANQLTCSSECKETRYLAYDREYRKRRREFIAGLQAENAMLKARVAELESELEDLKVSGATLKKPEKNLKFDTSGFEYCERMRLKMEKLPCGEHQDCWRSPECEKTQGMDREQCLQAIEEKQKREDMKVIIPRTEPYYNPIN